MFSRLFSLALIALATTAVVRGEPLAPVNERFGAAEAMETPDFQRHVLPLLGRLGCNGRACHGSFQGQGGFRLSLFGYDFNADLAALTDDRSGRVDLTHPASSLILMKPTLTEEHEGGERFAEGGWEYRLLHRWIETGAAGRSEDSPQFEALVIEPSEVVFTKPGEKQSLRVTAHWADGTVEDVTPLCRFQTNDDSLAEVSPEGVITALGPGDTHIVAFYDNGIAAAPVILPVSKRVGEAYPQVRASTEIDRLVLAKLRKVGAAPSEICTDAEFLRRASLDVTGTLPTPAEVEAFLADSSADKRARKIDELLSRPAYAAWLTTRLCDWLGNTPQNMQVGGEQSMQRDKSRLWQQWLQRRVAENRSYAEIAEGIIMAVSRREGQTDDEYFEEFSAYFRSEDPADFTERDTMPFFWCRGRFSPPQTLRFAHAFLGVRLECAECHKHPYDQWTQADYQDFGAFFSEVGFRYSSTRGEVKELKEKLGLTADQDSGGYKRLFAELAHGGTVVPWGEITAPDWQKRKPRPKAGSSGGRVITPRLLGGEAVIAEQFSDPREPVMQWLRDPENPYFARALVNRLWAGYFGIGLVEPADDMNLANPASNEPLLAWLARDFVASGYDLKHLQRTILTSDTYQRSWKPNETNSLDERNFSRALVRRLPAEVAFDALVFATSNSAQQQALVNDADTVFSRQIGFPENGRNEPGAYAVELFGKPDRQEVCDCARSAEPSLLQTIYLRNDAETLGLLSRKEGWIHEMEQLGAEEIRGRGDALIREAWLRTFSRPPRAEELEIGRVQLARGEDPAAALRNLLWALLNSKEFLLNH